MKKLLSCLALLICLTLVSCEIQMPKINLENDSVTLKIGETYEINVTSENITSPIYTFEVIDPQIAKMENNKIIPLKKGETTIQVGIKNENVQKVDFNLTVIDERQIHLEGSSTTIERKKQVSFVVVGVSNFINDDTIYWSSSNEEVAIVEDGIVTGLKVGHAIIKASVDGLEASIEVEIIDSRVITIKPISKLFINDEVKLELEPTEFVFDDPTCIWETSDKTIAKIENGILTALKSGEVVIYVRVDGLVASITIEIEEDQEAPVFVLSGVNEKETINWNEEFDPLKGVSALDNIDGNLTDKIEIEGKVDNQNYGTYTLLYKVCDRANNEATLERTIEVVWNYDVIFIGHAGSYYGIMNSEEAILYAIQTLKYQAIECDIKQTSDGVFVLSHDETFGDYNIASTSWDILKDVEVTKSRKAGYPSQNGTVTNSPYTTKLCTLERYLEICRQYNVKAVIELKSSKGITNSDQSRMQDLMDIIEKYNMRENTIFLGSQYNCLIWTREHGYSDIECQYLVNSCESDTVLERCIKYDLDVSINVTGSYSNSEEWLAKYQEANLKISTYTYTQWVNYDVVQEWIDKGVDYVTCDWHVMSNLKLPSLDDTASNIYHQVVFKNPDGTILKETKVKHGLTAAAPKNPTLEGYNFIGWSQSLKNITSDVEVIAQYELVKYNLTFNLNTTVLKEIEWEDKTSFVNEFYSDFYQWFLTNYTYNQSYITVNGQSVTINKNNKKVTFQSVEELMSIGIYDFELTCSNFIYKPVTRNSDGSCQIVVDEAYFLNSAKYLEKYHALDQYFYNAIKAGYPAYDTSYKPLSSGKIQMFFRFHQWATTKTSIPCFNNLPVKYESELTDIIVSWTPLNTTFTIEDELILSGPVSNKTFLGWYLDQECTIKVEKIEKGTVGDITLFAKWDIE